MSASRSVAARRTSGTRFSRPALVLERQFVALAVAAAGVGLAPTTTLGAQGMGSTRVIELFTSQGCPSCPPADRLIAELAKQPNTIAVSFAVNYWDYIGWKDTLASPAFTARQHAYAAARGDRAVFTPQAIVNGRSSEPGADEGAIARDLRISTRLPAPALSVTEAEGHVHVHIGGGGSIEKPVGVFVLRVVHTKTVEIARGENSGRDVTYTNVVRAMTKLGEWAGPAEDFQLLDLKGDNEGYVVLLQSGTPELPGPILAAAKTDGL